MIKAMDIDHIRVTKEMLEPQEEASTAENSAETRMKLD